jgi:Leucine-rich repeat (LRR) protein
MAEVVELDDGVRGRRATLRGPWTPELGPFLREQGVVELILNVAKGWRGDDLSFLAELPQLLSFDILQLGIEDIEPVHRLHELRRLGVTTYCKTPLDFAAFPHLEECALEWRTKATSLFECRTLRKLFVNRYSGKDLDPFGRLTALESLAVLNAPIENIRGVTPLVHLRHLRLANLKRLVSLAGLEQLTALEELEIHTCRRIESIEEIGRLTQLRTLDLDNDGPIQSLKPLARLQNLERVVFCESTDVLDGDLTPLLALEKLSRISFKNRAHYTHRREDFGAAYSGPAAR